MTLLPSQQLHYFERTQKIGEGTYGVVYKAFDRINNRVVALKIIKTDEQGISSTTLREVSMLRLLEHENIIAYDALCDLSSARLIGSILYFVE
jgi:serine/threonine protein kinase